MVYYGTILIVLGGFPEYLPLPIRLWLMYRSSKAVALCRNADCMTASTLYSQATNYGRNVHV